MSAPRTYRLYLLGIQKIFIFGIPIVFLVGWLFRMGALLLSDGGRSEAIIMIFPGLIVCLIWYTLLSYPYRIEIDEKGGITFVSLIKQKRVTPSEIETIQPDPRSQFGFLVIKYSRWKIRLLNQFDDFHDFITNLKTSNPSIKLRGC